MATKPAVPLAPGVFRIPTAGKDLINSFALVQDDGSVTLVDTGLSGLPPGSLLDWPRSASTPAT